jgi:putative membrane protein
VLTLGLFILVINAWIFMIIDSILDGFEIKNFWWALLYSMLISVANTLLF